MTQEETKEIMRDFMRKHGEAIQAIIDSVNQAISDGDGDSLMLLRLHLNIIVQTITDQLGTVADVRARSAGNN